MNISSANLANSSVASVGNVDAVGPSRKSPSSIPPPMTGAASASISTPGQFFSEMQQLSQQNPTAFKSVAAEVATSFQNAASQASGPQAQLLNKLANQFSQASETGSLQPPQGGQSPQAVQGSQGVSASQPGGNTGTHHHHHHHGGGGSATDSSQVQQAFQNALNIVNQAGTSASTSPGASTFV